MFLKDKIKDRSRLFIFIIIIFVFFIFILLPFKYTFAETEIAAKGVAVFALPGNSVADNTLTADSAEFINRIFIECGRFIPAGNREIEAAYNSVLKESGSDKEDVFYKTASLMQLDIYVLIIVRQLGPVIYSDIQVVPLKDEYKNMEKKARLRSKMKLNMPLKAGREIALLHKNLPVNASIIKSFGDDRYLIDAGEWHGIKNNKTYHMQYADLQIIQTGRYDSIVKIPSKKDPGDSITIKIFPDTGKIVNNIDKDISRNTISMYGLDNQNQGNAEKRLLEGICVVNMGGNLCFPGYGAFLSTGYLGIKDPKPDMPGVALSASAIAVQFLLPELMTGFKVNFFPWKQDSDKTDSMNNLQKFLWITIPVTYTAAYFDQLAYQFKMKETLPPFFNDKDNAAAVFSLLIPGGGLFFKGYRLNGWSFYFSEMLTAGYGIYNFDNSSGKFSLYVFGVIKLADIVYAYLVSPSYAFYNFEHERESSPLSFNIGIRENSRGDNIYNVMLTRSLE